MALRIEPPYRAVPLGTNDNDETWAWRLIHGVLCTFRRGDPGAFLVRHDVAESVSKLLQHLKEGLS